MMLTALVGGRSLRKRLRKLSQHQRLHWSRRVAVLLGGFGGICVGFYFYHLEETPVTNRVRFMPISHKQVQELTEREHTDLLEAFAPHILPAHHPVHQRVFVVTERWVMANQSKEMENMSWQVNVVDTEEMNAFVLPNGQIFMFTGMLKVLHNADSLAVVLGHEMSHVVLQHAAEKVSLHGFINMLLVISCALVWAVLPSDLLAIGAQWLQNMILAFLLHLPYSRKLEEEADEVGMNMAAKACFDVREGPKLWRQLALSKNNDDEPQLPAWLSTHPTHNDRADKLEGLLSKALKIRENCKCPPLSPGKLFKRPENSE
ncbi:PREDICTED: metalloendopeptidase OMA1, mitochondrial-like [Acropora digitifera]|uniref:metalloendopeptidase OMA1, mitochondrial-like n=1 Tax=Acropora digitifera TaxID=70779 RepID=UPI00077A177E|nr:PREDICTED: metalloendopeptidase OMA1, mitochondrial-like [Acropora digitifera]